MTNFVSLKSNPGRTITLAVLFASVVILGVFLYFASINTRIEGEREALEASARVQVEVSPLRAPSTDGYTVYLNAARIRAVASFKGAHYLATSGGLIALDAEGGVTRRFTSLDGLPENDLTALAVFRDRLFIGTSASGLIEFDGNGFTGFRLIKPKATRVSVLVATEAELLIGTFDGGLLQFDGESFSRRVNAAAGADLKHVTALLPIESRLYIGTQDRGLYIWREAHIENVATSGGLPSPHVTGLALLPERLSKAGTIAVATDFGVVALDEANTVENISPRPNITSLAVSGRQLWAGLFGGGVIELVYENTSKDDSPSGTASALHVAAGLPQAATRVCTSGGRLWALTDNGAYARDEDSSRPGFEPVAEALVSDRVLTGDHVTGLAFDGARRLWVGFFDRGIDVIAPDSSERLSHVEDERVREVNFIRFDSRDDRVLVATSRGLVAFDARMKQSLFTREKSGIVDDSVAHVAVGDSPGGGTNAQGSSILLATAGGLSEIAGGRARSITAFHGLASNHLYTVAVSGSRLFTGSLAGLVEIEGLRVVRTYKTSNSGLSHDWVTALAQSDGTLYIGTNGGGVDALLPTGEWVGFNDEVGRFEVNQNAMHIDGERICVGTADRGLLIYNTRARRWTRVSAGLPSQNVTAVASDESFFYAGTMNGLVRVEKRVIE
jgi:ligand-binding sensor domain-containing protein